MTEKTKVRDKLGESRKEIVDRLLDQMQQGELFWRCPWTDMLRPYNPHSHVTYKGGNRIRLMMAAFRHGYSDPRWMTFKQIQDAGYTLKDAKGTGVMLEHWRFTKMVETEDAHGNKTREEVPLDRPIPGFFYVFNGAYIEGLPELEMGEEQRLADIGEKIRRSSECVIEETVIPQAYYSVENDSINLPYRWTFSREEEFYATMLHEMGHSTGHPDRLNRETLEKYAESDEWRAREELRAELSSVFMRTEFGIPLEDMDYEQHGAYLQSWIACLRDDPDELFRAAADAEKACDRIMERYRELVMQEDIEEAVAEEVEEEMEMIM